MRLRLNANTSEFSTLSLAHQQEIRTAAEDDVMMFCHTFAKNKEVVDQMQILEAEFNAVQ